MRKTKLVSERPELSPKNPNHIPTERYYELKHFCLQYKDWKKALRELDGLRGNTLDLSGVVKKSSISNPTEKIALARAYYSTHIDIVDRCVAKLEPSIAPYILEGVTKGLAYEALRAKGCPYCRESYYKYYHLFFWLLSQERG